MPLLNLEEFAFSLGGFMLHNVPRDFLEPGKFFVHHRLHRRNMLLTVVRSSFKPLAMSGVCPLFRLRGFDVVAVVAPHPCCVEEDEELEPRDARYPMLGVLGVGRCPTAACL